MARAMPRFFPLRPSAALVPAHAAIVAAHAVLLGLCLVTGAAGIAADAKHDSNAPVNYAADHIELFDKQDRVLLTGNVVVTQDDMRLTSARGTVSYTNVKGNVQIQRLDASGDVFITRGDQNARGDVAIYDFNQRIITMVGKVVLHRRTDVMYGSRLVFDVDTGQSRMDGRGTGGPGGGNGQGRVSGSFAPPPKKDSGSGN